MTALRRGAAPPVHEDAGAIALARSAAACYSASTRRLLLAVAPRIARVVGSVLGGSHADVDDAVQLALIALIHALPDFRGECEPIHYASRIAVRTAVAVRKRARAAQARHDGEIDSDALASAQALPSEAAHAQRRRRLMRDLLLELPPEQAESMALRFVLGWSLDEVARATGAPINTVRSRVRLAKLALRRRIEEDPAAAEELGIHE